MNADLNILAYERDAPKFDVYTTEIWDKEWKRRQDRRCFDSFNDAYLWGLNSTEFLIIGEKFKRKFSEKELKDWTSGPFNRMDCEEVHWSFDKFGKLKSRLYDYGGLGFEYMPSDAEADAGTHFKKGDLVKYRDTVRVISLVPGRKKHNRWENYYAALEIIKKDDGRIFTSHEHPHESSLVKFTEAIDESSPLCFLHLVFAGKTKLTEKQINSIIDGELSDFLYNDTHRR
ncbi:MAG: hypothetical protein LBU89_01505 [Fibromonadaceae bacterium]|nr:hypothetical protein [Fibromonadaceae bacterium]